MGRIEFVADCSSQFPAHKKFVPSASMSMASNIEEVGMPTFSSHLVFLLASPSVYTSSTSAVSQATQRFSDNANARRRGSARSNELISAAAAAPHLHLRHLNPF
jgi:hypothetical protein